MPEPTKEELEQTRLDKAVQDAIDKLFAAPNWRARVTDTVRDSFKSRESNRKLKERVTELEKLLDDAKPKDGSVVLTKEDGVVWAAFQKLGKKPEELTTVLTEHKTLADAERLRKESEGFADAAESLGFKNIPALTRMLTRENLVLEFKDVRVKDENDKTVIQRTPFVRPKADDKATPEFLGEYLEREVPEFIPIFEAEPAGKDGDEEGGEEKETPAAGTRRGTMTPVSRSGVQIAATRGARETPAVPRDAKKLKEMEDEARASGNYAM